MSSVDQGQGQSLSLQEIDQQALEFARSLSAGSPRMEEGAGGSEGGGGGTVQGSDGVQSPEGGEPQGQQTQGEPAPQGGQGFLAEYLKDIPEDQRPIVEPVLERYRQEQDRNFNQRFEQLQEQNRIPVTIYESLLQDPVQTLNWIADRIQEEQGLDVRNELLQRWGQGQQAQSQDGAQAQGQEPQQQKSVEELVREEIERREQERLQQEQQTQFQKQQAEEQTRTVNSWVDSAAKNFGITLDDSQGPDPLREVIIIHANQIHESGQARGQAAVELAVEAAAKRFAAQSPSTNNGGQQPRVADGGSPPPAPKIDVADEKQRRERMLEVFGAQNQ